MLENMKTEQPKKETVSNNNPPDRRTMEKFLIDEIESLNSVSNPDLYMEGKIMAYSRALDHLQYVVAHKEPEVEGKPQVHPDCKRSNSCGESIMSDTTDQCRLGCVWLSGKKLALTPSQEEPVVKAGETQEFDETLISTIREQFQETRSLPDSDIWEFFAKKVGLDHERALRVIQKSAGYIEQENKTVKAQNIYLNDFNGRLLKRNATVEIELDQIKSAPSQKQEALTDEEIEKEARQFDSEEPERTEYESFTIGAKFARRRLTGK